MNCPNCSAEYQQGWEFCPTCATKLPKILNSQIIEAKPNSESLPTQLKKSTNFKFIGLGVILFISIIIWHTYSVGQNEKQVIQQATTLLTDGYLNNPDLTKATWGNYIEAKRILLTLPSSATVRPEADKLLSEIEIREAGNKIGDSQKIIAENNTANFDTTTAKTLRDALSLIKQTNKFYQQAQDTLPILREALDRSLIEKARQSLSGGKIDVAYGYLADINFPSKYENESKQIISELKEVEKSAIVASNIIKRKQFAKKLEDLFVKDMMDVYVSLSGDESEHLTLKYILWSRPLVMKFADDGKIYSNAKELGFKQITFTTGYREYWNYDL